MLIPMGLLLAYEDCAVMIFFDSFRFAGSQSKLDEKNIYICIQQQTKKHFFSFCTVSQSIDVFALVHLSISCSQMQMRLSLSLSHDIGPPLRVLIVFAADCPVSLQQEAKRELDVMNTTHYTRL